MTGPETPREEPPMRYAHPPSVGTAPDGRGFYVKWPRPALHLQSEPTAYDGLTADEMRELVGGWRFIDHDTPDTRFVQGEFREES